VVTVTKKGITRLATLLCLVSSSPTMALLYRNQPYALAPLFRPLHFKF